MRKGRVIKIVIVALILATGGGALALARLTPATGDFHGSAVPPLFGDAQLTAVHDPLKAAETRGHKVAKAWLDAHPVTSDKAFAAFAVQALGAPPGGKAPPKELAQLKALSAQRDRPGVTAATWLEAHGKKQPWKVFRKETKPFVPPSTYKTAKQALKDALDLGATLQAAAKTRYARPSPYQADPSVNALNQAKFAGQTRQSYPSKHTVLAGAALALLEPLQPHMTGEYDWMADEIAFSRMYAGGHYLSDLTAGAFLGTLIGDYERRKAGLTG
jgi:PAP2 superfamily